MATDHRIKKYQDAKRARKEAEEWNDLPNGRKYQNDKFNISSAHCIAPMLCRMGQQSSGGSNYWKTEKNFNQAILDYIIFNWKVIYLGVLERMKKQETDALKECQSFIDEMQKIINEN